MSQALSHPLCALSQPMPRVPSSSQVMVGLWHHNIGHQCVWPPAWALSLLLQGARLLCPLLPTEEVEGIN